MRELVIPPETEGDSRATEMIRVWLAHQDVHVSLLLGMWEDADDAEVDEREAWGNVLADVARHIANGMRQSHAWEEKDTIAKIKKAFIENIEYQERKISGGYSEA
jgi:predicted secreted Zn-dependent protease